MLRLTLVRLPIDIIVRVESSCHLLDRDIGAQKPCHSRLDGFEMLVVEVVGGRDPVQSIWDRSAEPSKLSELLEVREEGFLVVTSIVVGSVDVSFVTGRGAARVLADAATT